MAALYGVSTKVLNQAVSRNPERFPDDFMFQLSLIEHESLKSQFVTSNVGRGGIRKLPFAFIELRLKVEALEKTYDANFRIVFDAIRKMLSEPTPKEGEIGFKA